MSPETPTVEEARLQFYNISRWFLNCINENEFLKPYLVYYPFTIENLDLFIFYSQRIPGRICAVTMGISLNYGERPNFVYYYGYNSSGTLIKIHQEPYKEGMEIVREFQSKNPECFLYPHSSPLKYLDKNKWIKEVQRIEGKSFGDNYLSGSIDEVNK